MKLFITKIGLVVIILLGLFVPSVSFAAQLYITTNRDIVSVGDTIVVHFVLDTEQVELNAVDGTISIPNLSEIASTLLTDAGSVLSVWPQKLALTKNGNAVQFIGGSPNGFNSSNSKLFDLVLNLQKEGERVIHPVSLQGYKNDGKGTQVNVQNKDITIRVKKVSKNTTNINEWNSTIANDTNPPSPFQIMIGRDTSLYDNKQFISFASTDTDSGIDYYEVIEGSSPPVRSEELYVLVNQNIDEDIVVRAFDKAGNSQQSKLHITTTKSSHIVRNSVFIFLACLILFIVLYKRRNK